MDLTEALKRAAEIVEEASLPTDLRSAAFGKAVDSLLGASGNGESSPRGPEGRQDSDSGAARAIAQRLNVAQETVDEVYEIKDGCLDVVLGYSRIAASVAAGARQLAVVVAAGRQATGIDREGWTSVSEIRSICRDFNKFDSSNFAATIAQMDQIFSVAGNGQDRRVRLTRAGWEHAARLIAELTSN